MSASVVYCRALADVLAVLGPEPCSCPLPDDCAHGCAGSRAEAAEAIRIVQEALGYVSDGPKEFAEVDTTEPEFDKAFDGGEPVRVVTAADVLARVREIIAGADASGASPTLTVGLIASVIRPARPDSIEAIRARVAELVALGARLPTDDRSDSTEVASNSADRL